MSDRPMCECGCPVLAHDDEGCQWCMCMKARPVPPEAAPPADVGHGFASILLQSAEAAPPRATTPDDVVDANNSCEHEYDKSAPRERKIAILEKIGAAARGCLRAGGIAGVYAETLARLLYEFDHVPPAPAPEIGTPTHILAALDLMKPCSETGVRCKFCSVGNGWACRDCERELRQVSAVVAMDALEFITNSLAALQARATLAETALQGVSDVAERFVDTDLAHDDPEHAVRIMGQIIDAQYDQLRAALPTDTEDRTNG